ncbi:MAG: hypothetical protein IRY85_10075 [Micromonosporaceae bacterium]|nr:hypothetical protein [Micromonosporaceae bacterium]
MLIIDDFVMLGKTVPEPNRDGRVFVCSAGYSPTLRSLIRIYPLSRYAAPPTWSISTVKLERNPMDSRAESYRLAGDRRPGVHDHINRRAFEVHGMVPRAQRAELLKRCVFPSIAAAQQRQPGYGKDKMSLAILHPESIELEFEHNPASPDSPQLALFDAPGDVPSGARRFPYIPRLRFRDSDGEHRLMLREWGVYELMRKHNNLTQMSDGERKKFVGGALHLDPSCSLLVGNMNNQRTAWLVIAVLRGLRAALSLFDAMEAA